MNGEGGDEIGNKCKQECLWLKSMRFSNKLHFCFLLIFIPEQIFPTENQNSPRHIFTKATRNCDRFHFFCLEAFFTIKSSPLPPLKKKLTTKKTNNPYLHKLQIPSKRFVNSRLNFIIFNHSVEISIQQIYYGISSNTELC